MNTTNLQIVEALLCQHGLNIGSKLPSQSIHQNFLPGPNDFKISRTAALS